MKIYILAGLILIMGIFISFAVSHPEDCPCCGETENQNVENPGGAGLEECAEEGGVCIFPLPGK